MVNYINSETAERLNSNLTDEKVREFETLLRKFWREQMEKKIIRASDSDDD